MARPLRSFGALNGHARQRRRIFHLRLRSRPRGRGGPARWRHRVPVDAMVCCRARSAASYSVEHPAEGALVVRAVAGACDIEPRGCRSMPSISWMTIAGLPVGGRAPASATCRIAAITNRRGATSAAALTRRGESTFGVAVVERLCRYAAGRTAQARGHGHIGVVQRTSRTFSNPLPAV